MSRAVYFFRNIRTKQVLATTAKSLLTKPKLVKNQIPDPTLRPTVLRPDHWTPLVVATGFESKQAQTDAFNLTSQPGHPFQPKTEKEQKEYTLLMNKNKRLADKDCAEKQIAQLARSLVYMDVMKSQTVPKKGKVRLLWENREWIKKVEEAGLYWPAWVEHGDLDIKRGNIIINPELRVKAPAVAAASAATVAN